MATFDYAPFVALARNLIEKYGTEVTWEKNATSVDPDKPWNPSAADPDPATFPVIIAFLPLDFNMLQSAITPNPTTGNARGTNLPVGTIQGLMEGGVPFTPEMQDTIVLVGGRRVKPLTIDTLNPGGTPVLHTIQVAL